MVAHLLPYSNKIDFSRPH